MPSCQKKELIYMRKEEVVVLWGENGQGHRDEMRGGCCSRVRDV
jgi:hypothetical protein